MFKTTLKNLRAHKLRLLTTSFAVMLGVAFMAGTLVLTDTIGQTFNGLFEQANAGTSAVVRGKAAIKSDNGDQRASLDQSVVARVASVPGVAAAQGYVEGYAQIIGRDGKPMGDPEQGAPTNGANWITTAQLNPFKLADGHAPTGARQVVVDRASATKAGFHLGDTVKVISTAGPESFELVGTARFGDIDSPGGASFAFFDDTTAQRLLAEPGAFNLVKALAAPGVSDAQVVTAIRHAVPTSTEVLTGTKLAAEQKADVQEGLGFFNTFLLSFAVIALFVGSFIIYNAFSILVAQRSKEMALMRAIGASRRQVLGSVLLESVAVGLTASVAGLVAGIGVARLLQAMLGALGIEIPAGGLVVAGSTVVISVVAGVSVCVASAIFPARAAARVAPVAAMRSSSLDTSSRSRGRLVTGLVVTGLGAAVMSAGLFGDAGIALVAVGAVAVFVGVAVLGPVLARPLSRVLGFPVAHLKGMSGTLARENAMRNPKRTASTASALMIGVALVGFITILAASTKASVHDSMAENFTGDLVVSSTTDHAGGFPPAVAGQVKALPQVGESTGLRLAAAQIKGEGVDLVAVDPPAFGRILDMHVKHGSLDALGAGSIGIDVDTAQEQHLHLGDAMTVRFADSGKQSLKVEAIYPVSDLIGPYLIGLDTYAANVHSALDVNVLVKAADGVSVSQLRHAVAGVTAAYPQAELQDRDQFVEKASAQIDQLLNLVYALLGLAVIIALLGIANTLALSIFERTRELGLLRAVGMTRSQLRSTVRGESVIIALLGTTLGLAIGVGFGWAIVTALSGEGISTFALPVTQLVVIAVIAAVAGVAAAVLPARRASKLNVLDAITGA